MTIWTMTQKSNEKQDSMSATEPEEVDKPWVNATELWEHQVRPPD